MRRDVPAGTRIEVVGPGGHVVTVRLMWTRKGTASLSIVAPDGWTISHPERPEGRHPRTWTARGEEAPTAEGG